MRKDIVEPRAAQADEQEHFRRSWAAFLLDDPTRYEARSMSSRRVKADLEDSLFGDTLASDKTIRHILSFQDRSMVDKRETLILASLGDGVCGHSHVVHGGFTAMLIDEACGLANMNHNEVHTLTAYLNINYKAPIPAPSIVLCRALITRIEGRKRFVRCTVEGAAGVLYAECDALFLEFKEGFKL